jgi:hypothetical protein
LLASEYSWSLPQILDIPMSQLGFIIEAIFKRKRAEMVAVGGPSALAPEESLPKGVNQNLKKGDKTKTFDLDSESSFSQAKFSGFAIKDS